MSDEVVKIKRTKLVTAIERAYCPKCNKELNLKYTKLQNGEKSTLYNIFLGNKMFVYTYNCPDCNIDVILDKLYPRNINVEVAFDESTTMGEN